MEVKRIDDWILSLKMVLEQETFSIISAYASQIGLKEWEKNEVLGRFGGLVQGIPLQENIILGRDFNGQVSKKVGQYVGFHGGLVFGELNKEGKSFLDFSMAYGSKTANTCFKK